MEGIHQDNLSNLPCHGSLVGDIELEDYPLEDRLPLEDMINDAERELLSHPSLQDDEMPDVIVTELQTWKKSNHHSHHGSRQRRICHHRINELAKPKVNHQIVVDRPSVYWTDKIQPDTTLSVTSPIVTPRLEELSRPKRFYSTYYNESRSTPIWPISRASLEAKASPRLKVLAYPKIRNNIWVVDSSETGDWYPNPNPKGKEMPLPEEKIQVSKATQVPQAKSRTLELATPKSKSLSNTDWFLDPKAANKRSPDFNRIYNLAMPKILANNYTYDKPCSWVISHGTKNAVASKRILYLAKPKERKDYNEGHDPYYISMAAMRAEPSPRIYELAAPKRVAKKI
ncbi:testicular haploid expressed gene protein [Sarcophilus harrisii]|uniref:Theg spermatid protein n=1 Tax=Sarcophilus harrisii TaxID=9305 RepID=G3WER8_SARHA|nr:testicular haploid expressed gene protein [Sarcophilus harrisii]